MANDEYCNKFKNQQKQDPSTKVLKKIIYIFNNMENVLSIF